jgi:hypothetical protein
MRRTIHLMGPVQGLDSVVRLILGVSLVEIDDIFHGN